MRRTPIETSRTFDAKIGAKAFFKCENLQRAGAFKFRGATHAMTRLTAEERERGVLTFSSGNHAQALALAGRNFSAPVTVIMPSDAPEVKVRATKGYGATVISYERDETTREAFSQEYNKDRNLTVVPPYDHPWIIAGQGTAAAELLEDVPDLDVLIVPCGGGGLLSGSALAARAARPGIRIIGVEPEAGNDGCLSFQSKSLQSVRDPQTIADGARTPSLGHYTFPLILDLVDDMVTVTDGELVATMGFIWERMKLVVEPTGVLAAAYAVKRAGGWDGAKIGIVLSGGNVDLARAGEFFA
ncbi:MAG: L-threo-3-hydroxyaspartate ammonia-lyase [Fimbriimonadaceae bacterium]|nr:L-threo-3-hydroxyaspartate ammonia-lyase [Fimbriimonadaceae bacterium]